MVLGHVHLIGFVDLGHVLRTGRFLELENHGMDRRSDIKSTASPLWFPNDIEKGKGAEFMSKNLASIYEQVTEYWSILDEVDRSCTDYDPANGTFYKPPSGADGFTAVHPDMRPMYAIHAGNLYNRLEAVIPAAIMTKVRSTFNYGPNDTTFACPIGDGPSLIWSIAVLYRPSGEIYREALEAKAYAAPQKLRDGSSPRKWVGEFRTLLREVLALGVNLKWNLCGKKVVNVLSERSNTFAQKLTKFASTGNIVDIDDSAVELDEMLSAIEVACDELESSGMQVNIKANGVTFGGAGGGGNTKPCNFGNDCFRKDCKFGHPVGWNSEEASKRNSKKRGRDGSGKGGGSGGVKLCKAKGCQTESKSFQYCKPCHRKGIESGFITRKDGSKDDIKDRAKGGDGNGFSKKDIRGLKALIKLDKNSDKEDEFDLRSKLSGAGPVSELKKRAARAVREADQAEHEAKKQRLMDELQALEDER